VARQPVHLSIPERVPAGTEADGDGIVIGGGPATVDLYIDFICPFCRQFEEASASVLAAIVAANAASLVYHPLGFLDRLSSTGYSSRAAAASGCASDGNKFIEYKDVLFRNQPEEGGAGLSDAELAELGLALGLDPGLERCIGEGRYLEWAAYVTARAPERGVSGTPTAFVDGVPVPADGRTIAAAVKGHTP
jgi:protein-disulfide isomerase